MCIIHVWNKWHAMDQRPTSGFAFYSRPIRVAFDTKNKMRLKLGKACRTLSGDGAGTFHFILGWFRPDSAYLASAAISLQASEPARLSCRYLRLRVAVFFNE
jgi:hypothetical protein